MTSPVPFTDRALAGVYHAPASGLAGPLAAAAAQGLVCRSVDLAGRSTRTEVFAAFAEALDFPDDFGHNWDALYDALCDLEWLAPDGEGAGWLLALSGVDTLHGGDPEGFATLLDVLAGACDYWRDEGGCPFWAILDMEADGIAMLPGLG